MAASSTAVTVLAPNGRRQTIKISYSTPLLQVLEDVCKKQGFSPGEYDLKFQRAVLDLSLQWRFASLPNNAKLEMVPSTRQRTDGESRVRIALQLEDGSRLQDSFSSAQTLWELISHFPQTRTQDHWGGGFEEDDAEVSGSDWRQRHRQVRPEKAQHQHPGASPAAADWPVPPSPEPRPIREEADGNPEPQQVVRPKTCPPPEERAGPSTARAPDFVPFMGGGQRLGGQRGHGLPATGDAPRNYSSTPSGPPEAKKPKPSNDAKQQASAQWSGESAEFLEPVDREPLVYHLDATAHCHGSGEDLPDEFFEVTVDDVRKRFAQLKSERKVLEEAPMMTKALRESRMKEKMERYPKVVLRVQFPDRHILQGFFRPLETVGTLRQFVKSHLADPQLSFYLFIAPPKTTLDDPTTTLFQANLFPAALVYLGSDVHTDSWLQSQLIGCSVSSLQADKAIAGFMPRSPPSSSAPLLSDECPPQAGQQGAAADRLLAQTDSEGSGPTSPEPSKVPKWLKLPGKK
ncbi:hypothetical protein AAFF_G00348590 [Aldrovandia affinis]|uniref:UBX domain-containing protein n=1 Tax=Aldrovandia affinis TaxID=143900 RepID=A0AAD7R640_9TELE|nr:hypothetical protein AAFF_G00348590 [Aldrovandia affinis]